MASLYNLVSLRGVPLRIPNKVALLVVFAGAGFGLISCRKADTATADHAAMRPTADVIAEADADYAGRSDLVKVRQAIVALRQAQADDPTSYDLAWRLAKFNYYLGSHTPESREQDKAFREGLDAGKLAVKLQDGKPEGHFWLGANYGGTAQISTFAGLGEIEDIKHEMETVLKLDESYQAGSAYMVLGQVYLESPRLLGGDVNKAIGYLEKGIKIGPDNELMRVKLAEAYADAHRYDEARKQIDTLMAMKPTPNYEPEYNEAITEAKKVQEKIK
jgi:tetratricopeptide (TPR) repeat protein